MSVKILHLLAAEVLPPVWESKLIPLGKGMEEEHSCHLRKVFLYIRVLLLCSIQIDFQILLVYGL